MRAHIFQPAKTAMQSGTGKSRHWVLDYVPQTAREVDPLMGWTSSDDMQSQVRLTFETKQAAIEYARAKELDFTVTEPKVRKPNVRPGGYADNFSPNRRGAWTH
ncbi:MAG: NADH dehydrogenase [Paracoccaceae bacterium]|jgi:NADH dehydrogenase